MSNATQHSLVRLKRLVRKLKRERQWKQVFTFCQTRTEVTTVSDSDWAGDTETRTSSSAGRDADRQSYVDSTHAQTEDHHEKEAQRPNYSRCGIGSTRVGSKRVDDV